MSLKKCEGIWISSNPGTLRKCLLLKAGSWLSNTISNPPQKKPADSAAVVQQLLDTHAIAGNRGVFRLERDGKRLHIIVAASKGKDGVLVARQSVLDAVITVPAQKRNGLELLNAICAAISEASRTRVVVGGAPLNLFYRHQTESGAKNQRARDFLTNEPTA